MFLATSLFVIFLIGRKGGNLWLFQKRDRVVWVDVVPDIVGYSARLDLMEPSFPLLVAAQAAQDDT